MEDLLLRLKIAPDDWDLIIVGDGSGSNWNYHSGWASISIEKATLNRRVWYGGMNCGTVNFSEMMAYLQPLNWYLAVEADRRKKTSKVRFRKVHIVTDSKYCKDRGNSNERAPRKNAPLWRIFDEFKRHGLLLHWHWIPRASVDLNVFADKLSKEARLALKNSSTQDIVENGFDNFKNVYDCNP